MDYMVKEGKIIAQLRHKPRITTPEVSRQIFRAHGRSKDEADRPALKWLTYKITEWNSGYTQPEKTVNHFVYRQTGNAVCKEVGDKKAWGLWEDQE